MKIQTPWIEKHRGSADGRLRAVMHGGRIKASTLSELCHLLDSIQRPFHIEVAVHPVEGITSLLKTIDNEMDAKETIENIKRKQNFTKGGRK